MTWHACASRGKPTSTGTSKGDIIASRHGGTYRPVYGPIASQSPRACRWLLHFELRLLAPSWPSNPTSLVRGGWCSSLQHAVYAFLKLSGLTESKNSPVGTDAQSLLKTREIWIIWNGLPVLKYHESPETEDHKYGACL
jgi:hypothetical protein